MKLTDIELLDRYHALQDCDYRDIVEELIAARKRIAELETGVAEARADGFEDALHRGR